MSDVLHMPPLRHPGRFWALMFGCCATPIFWLGQLTLGYLVSAEICYGSDHPTVTAAPQTLRTLLFIFDLVAIVAALSGAFVSFLCLRAIRQENSTGLESKISRNRGQFMAAWGLLSSVCFLAAIVFETIGSAMAPLCTP